MDSKNYNINDFFIENAGIKDINSIMFIEKTSFAKEITDFAKKFSHMPISWDSDESTFSLKYNFAFDKLLGLNLFPQEIFEKEIDCYLKKINKLN